MGPIWPAQQITRQIRAIGIYRTMPIIRLHPRSGRQKVLAKASNKRPHFPQWPLLFGLLCFFSGSSLVTWLANGTLTSSPAWISKGLQSSPTKVVFMHNLGCLNLDTSTKWIFCRNQLERLAWLRPTVQLLWLHFTWLRLLVVADVVAVLLDIESSCGSCCLCSCFCWWWLSALKAIWPSYPPVIMTDGGGGGSVGGWNIARTTSSSGEMKSEKKEEEEKGH